MTAEPDALRLVPEHATDEALSLAPVLRSRGQRNSLHDIKRAANLLELLALDVSRRAAAPAVQPAAGMRVHLVRGKVYGDLAIRHWVNNGLPEGEHVLYAHPPAQASESGPRLRLQRYLEDPAATYPGGLDQFHGDIAALSAPQAAPGSQHDDHEDDEAFHPQERDHD